MIQEIQVMGVGAPAEYGNMLGAAFNVVTKSGTNQLKGGANFYWYNNSLVDSDINFTESENSEFVQSQDFVDFTATMGGAFKKDRAWFFVDWWDFEIQRLVLNVDEIDSTKLRDLTLNINAQINDNNKVSGRWLYSGKYRNNRRASQSRPYLGRIQDSASSLPQLQWQSVNRQNIFTDVRFSTVRADYPQVRRWGPGGDQPLGIIRRADIAVDDLIPCHIWGIFLPDRLLCEHLLLLKRQPLPFAYSISGNTECFRRIFVFTGRRPCLIPHGMADK
jgi:hypothetical protein